MKAVTFGLAIVAAIAVIEWLRIKEGVPITLVDFVVAILGLVMVGALIKFRLLSKRKKESEGELFPDEKPALWKRIVAVAVALPGGAALTWHGVNEPWVYIDSHRGDHHGYSDGIMGLMFLIFGLFGLVHVIGELRQRQKSEHVRSQTTPPEPPSVDMRRQGRRSGPNPRRKRQRR